MAITKIMHLKSPKTGNVAAHLKHSLAYICNEAKTDNGNLVGSINCLPDFSFEQMIQTKEIFGKTGGRQGYHFIIALEPGEGNAEDMLEIMRRFAEEFLYGKYEAVYAVHNDKNHIHGHLVFNSVNMITGRKYNYKKGDWKEIIQPITNKLCEEYGLSILAAEYSENPVNMNRKEWEKEQSWSDVVEADMKYCRSRAKSVEEFLFFMEELGYEVKFSAHISVKAGKMKRSRRLDTLDEEFSKEKLEDLKTERKEAKNEKNVAERCLRQNLYACLEVPDDLDIENLYLTDWPKMEKQEVVADVRPYFANEEEVAFETVASGIMDEQIVDVVESVDVQDYGEVLTEIEDVVADFGTEICETTEDTQLPEAEMTRELYEDFTDKEKAEWIGITPDNTDESIRLFTEKMKELGITYRYSSDMLDEFMRLEEVVLRESRTNVSSYQWNREQERKR